MSEPQNLRASDARRAFRLLGECLDLWDDAPAWRRQAMTGAARLVRGRVTHWTAVSPTAQRGASISSCGWDNSQEQDAYLAALQRPIDVVLPGVQDYLAAHAGQEFTPYRVTDVMPLSVWRRTIGFNEHNRPANCDSMIVSHRTDAAGGGWEMFGVSRSLGDRPFTRRELLLLDFFHRELKALVGVRLATEEQLGRHLLPRRLRQTLEGVLAGLNERQLAERIGVSPATVHQYVGMLYARFGVGSRHELLSYYVARRPATR